MTERIETKRERIESLRSSLRTEFNSSWRPHLQDIAEHLYPRGIRFDAMSERNRGYKRNQKIINGHGTLALRTAQHGMMSGISSPARPWFRVTTPDPDLAEFEPVKYWLYGVTRRLNELFARSNFYNTLSGLYRHLLAFATGAMIMEEGDLAAPDGGRNILRCMGFPIGSYVLAVGAYGRVDTFIRTYAMTVRQIVRRFGDPQAGPNTRWKPFSQTVRNLWDQSNYETTLEVVHSIMPNMEYEPRYLSAKYKRFASCYFEAASGDKQQFLRESGYEEFPVLSPRWDLASPDDVYGSACPGMEALGDVRHLQLLEKRKAQAIEKAYNPPLMGPSALRNAKVSSLPGDVTYVDINASAHGLKPIYEVKPDIQGLLEDVNKREKLISRAFYEDLFLMLANDARSQPPTAEEVRERHEEKLLMLGPVLDRLNDEAFNPAIDIGFSILRNRGTFDPGMALEPPPELEGMDLKVEYISIMHQAQKMIATASMDRFVRTVGELATYQRNAGLPPTAWDKLDVDETIDEYADTTGVPPRMVVPKEKVDNIRDQRAKQQQAQQTAALAEQAAATGKTMSETNLDGDNALTRVLQQRQGTPT